MRTTSKILGVAVAALSVAGVGTALPAGAVPHTSTPQTARTVTSTAPGAASTCKGASVKPVVHADALRREATLTALMNKLHAHDDRYGLNGPQSAALESARSAVVSLDAQIASTCYPTLAALKADSSKLFVDYRVYWLRVPQTNVIVAADALAGARARVGSAAAKLAPLAGSNAQAASDLAAMNAALSAADARLGTPPGAGPAIAPVAGLQPAADMTGDTATLQAAHAALVAAAASIAQARADGAKVVADLRS